MLNAERSTLFLNDEKTGELWSEVGPGSRSRCRSGCPNHVGIAGAVFTSGKTINIPYAYADLRFNPAFDKKTGLLHALDPVRARSSTSAAGSSA